MFAHENIVMPQLHKKKYQQKPDPLKPLVCLNFVTNKNRSSQGSKLFKQ